MKDICFCLGINFELNDKGVSLCQKQCLMKLLSVMGWLIPILSLPNGLECEDDGYSKRVDAAQYQSMVGSLLHAARATRPDIAFAVSTVSKFNAAPYKLIRLL